ncbi:MAG: prolyl oligopeptidase family serine peptidase [Pirellulaceae bacterium]
MSFRTTYSLACHMIRISAFRVFTYLVCTVALFAANPGDLLAQSSANWYQRQTEWHGFDQFHFQVAERNAYLVVPKKPLDGNPWIWRARFPGYHAEMDIQLVKDGFHIAYVDVAGLFGAPAAVKIGDQFYSYLTTQRGLAKTMCLEGVSRGGLFVYNWAAANTDKVACIYCDTPVCSIASWPGGKGTGKGHTETWQQCLQVYGLSDQQAAVYDKNPIDHARAIAGAKIPILHIVSENDEIVPPSENTYVLQQRLRHFGHDMDVIVVEQGTAESNGHHFTHPDPAGVIAFVKKHATNEQ